MKRHPIFAAAAILWLTLAAPTGWALAVSYNNQQAIHRQQVRLIDYQVTNKVDGCRASNNARKALQSVLDSAAHPPPTTSSAVNFRAITGFRELDPATQFFLVHLEATLAKPGANTNLKRIAADYRRTNPSNVDCAKVGRDLRRTLVGPPRA